MNLQGQQILFIGPKTFGYEKEIKRELELTGCKVDWYNDRPASTSIVKALIRVNPKLVTPLSNAYFNSIINKTRIRNYNVVFVIKGEALASNKIRELRKSQPNARFIYYTWDSLSNYKNSRQKLQYFDKIYSFDPYDCLDNENIKHLPLFYTRAYESIKGSKHDIHSPTDIDLLLLGSVHSDRHITAQKIWKASLQVVPGIRVYEYYYFHSRWAFALLKLFDRRYRNIPWRDIKWTPLDPQQTLSLVAKSKILIDIHHPHQTGMTMRTIESIGAQKKIITTNAKVINYDFYKPQNILVIDRANPKIDKDFLLEPYQPLDYDVYHRYSLREWIRNIFS